MRGGQKFRKEEWKEGKVEWQKRQSPYGRGGLRINGGEVEECKGGGRVKNEQYL